MAKEKKSEHLYEVEPSMPGYQKAQAAVGELQLKELVALRAEMGDMIVQRQREKKKDIYAQMFELAKAAGFASVEEFIASQKVRAPRADKGVKMPPKYRSKDGQKTWSGKGRKPDWAIAHLESGGSLEDLIIA